MKEMEISKSDCSIKRRQFKSFFIPEQTDKELAYLVEKNGECASAVIRRLITEAYTFLKYLEGKK
jgi:hypothetical protein